MTFEEMIKNDPQENSTAEHKTVDTTGSIHLLGQPTRKIELSYIDTNPKTKVSTPMKSITFETVLGKRHISITMSAPAINFVKYAPIFAQMLDSFKLNDSIT